jgi:hypothetical protein
VVHGELFLFAALFLETEQKPFPGRIIVFELEVHDGVDPGESVGKDSEQSAIAEPGVSGYFDLVQKLLNSPSTNAGVLPSVRENFSVLTSRAGFIASTILRSARNV